MLHGPKRTQQRARSLRQAMSFPEVILWRELRKRPAGLKFRRQHPAGPYILDFYCAAHQLAVEIDGEAHERGDRPVRDEARDAWLIAQGVKVVRIIARDVIDNLEGIVDHIINVALNPSTA